MCDIGDHINRHYKDMRRFALHLVRNAADAEDVAQDAALSAIEKWSTFRGESAVRTWLLSFVKYKALNYHYNKRRLSSRHVDDGEAALGLCLVQASQEHSLALSEFSAALAQLSPVQRHAIFETRVMGMNLDDLSKAANVPEGTLKTRAFYGRQKLAEAGFALQDGR